MKLETFIRIIEALQVSADSLLRPDVPEVRSLYQSEFDELLARLLSQGAGFHPEDCS